jgi:hypothetical protein
MSKKVIYFNDDEILKGGDMDSIKSNTNHNTFLTSNSNIHVGGGEGNKVVKEGRDGGEMTNNNDEGVGGGEIEEGELTNNNDEGEGGGVMTNNNEEGEGVMTNNNEEGEGGGVMTNNNEEGEGGGVMTNNNEGEDVIAINDEEEAGEEAGEEDEEEAGEEDEEDGGDDENNDNCGTPLLRGGASESIQLNQLVEQLLATNMAKISNQLTSQTGGGQNITDVLSGINEQLSNLNTNIGKIIQLNNKNI